MPVLELIVVINILYTLCNSGVTTIEHRRFDPSDDEDAEEMMAAE